jgi:hypothetical protein
MPSEQYEWIPKAKSYALESKIEYLKFENSNANHPLKNVTKKRKEPIVF